MNAFLRQYIETALWSSNDWSTPDGGEPMDANHSAEDIAPETLATMAAECAAFEEANADDIDDDGQAGHDFWLTRNGHGTGFWDRDGDPATMERLTEASRKAGVVDLYVGDDGLVYQ